MKPENCKVGMKVERFWENHNNVRKNSIYTVKALRGEDVKLEETNDEYWYDLNLFRPVSKNPKPANKFEVGEPVDFRYYDGTHYKAEIWGIADKKDDVNWIKYGISFIKKGYHRVTVVREDRLSPLKKPDELEVGDKFRQKGKAEHEVIGVHYDEERESKIYVVRLLDGKIKGAVDLVFPETITEIVYE